MARVEDFKMLWQFPNCVAAIDGKHIVKPAKSGSLYYNYKKMFVLFVLTDARYNSKHIDASSSASDSGVWSRTLLGKQIASGSANLPKAVGLPNVHLPPLIAGDDAFSLGEHLMKPHSKNKLTNDEVTFNERLSYPGMLWTTALVIYLANRFCVYHTFMQRIV